MAASSPKMAEELEAAPLPETESGKRPVRVILADSQAIFRAGLRKIFALEDDLRVVAQAETLSQTLSAAGKFEADVILLESAMAPHPAEAIMELAKAAPSARIVVVTSQPTQDETLEFYRRGAQGIVSRTIEPELLMHCLRKVAGGEPWLDEKSANWVLQAYRSQGIQSTPGRPHVHLTQKEMQIVACVTQGMKNKEIASRVGTTEQVVKNYLRKVYDKLGVSDRLELALYCLNHKVIENGLPAELPERRPTASESSPAAALLSSAFNLKTS
jgi:DNA-binding NarL/FixJ family response regulator